MQVLPSFTASDVNAMIQVVAGVVSEVTRMPTLSRESDTLYLPAAKPYEKNQTKQVS